MVDWHLHHSSRGRHHLLRRLQKFCGLISLYGNLQRLLALEGESGSGKTTFLHLIAGILKPDAGRIVLAGQEMSALNEPARDRLRATTIGYIFQTFNLLQGYPLEAFVLLLDYVGVIKPFTPGALRLGCLAVSGR